MEREFLEQFDLGSTVIDAVLEQSEKEIKDLCTERDGLAERLEGFSGKDFEAIEKNAKEMEEKYLKETAQLRELLEKKDFDAFIKDKTREISFSSLAAKKAFMLDLEQGKFEKDEDGNYSGFDDFLNEYKEADPTAFEKGKEGKTPVFSKAVLGSGSVKAADNRLLAAFGVKTR